jgi:hypothetical protein
MIEQWYAKHKVTGEIFCHKGRYCFSEKGLRTAVRNVWGTWEYANPHKDYDYSRKCIDSPESQWEFRKVELT